MNNKLSKMQNREGEKNKNLEKIKSVTYWWDSTK